MSQYNYVVTASKPTVVTHALQCSFTGADDHNLILVYVTTQPHANALSAFVYRYHLFGLFGSRGSPHVFVHLLQEEQSIGDSYLDSGRVATAARCHGLRTHRHDQGLSPQGISGDDCEN